MIKVNLTAKYFLVHVQPGGNTVEHLLLLVTLLMGQLLKCSNWDAKLDIYGCVLEYYRAKGHQVITTICLIQKKNCYKLDYQKKNSAKVSNSNIPRTKCMISLTLSYMTFQGKKNAQL